MDECYCTVPAVRTAIDSALDFRGLDADPAAVFRRPAPALTFGEQMHRVEVGRAVLAEVRSLAAVSDDDRQLIFRLVDSGCARLEECRRTAVAGVALLDSTAKPVVDRQDVRPSPMTDPGRQPDRRKPPGTTATAKTSTTSRTIRSVRWGGTEVRR